jgi:lipocalin
VGGMNSLSGKPNKLGNRCSGSTATYDFESLNTIRVLNVCYNEKSENIASVTGHATIINPNYGWFKLRLDVPSFSKSSTSADYLVHATDYTTYAMVGTPNRDALWILVRPNKTISKQRYDWLVGRAKIIGYPVDKLRPRPTEVPNVRPITADRI